jgi:hypothetical protein
VEKGRVMVFSFLPEDGCRLQVRKQLKTKIENETIIGRPNSDLSLFTKLEKRLRSNLKLFIIL